MENFFSLKRATLLIAVFWYFSSLWTYSFAVYDINDGKIQCTYLFSAMSRLYLHIILERDHLLE